MNINEIGIFAAGSLAPANEYQKASKAAKSLKADFPVLTAPLEEKDLIALMSQPNLRHCLSFGSCGVPAGELLTIRLQLGGVQVYWVADISDPEIWAAIDAWTMAGKAAIALTVPHRKTGNCAFMVVEMKGWPRQLHDAKNKISTGMPARIWEDMGALAASGTLQMQATTDLLGVRLSRVLVNTVLTSRIRKYDDRAPLHVKPVLTNNVESGMRKN